MSSTEFLILTDDDAVPSPSLLEEWEKTFESRPAHVLFGGGVVPLFPRNTPKWLARFERHFPELYAKIERQEGEVDPVDIFGPNMAMKRTVFENFRFNEDIGPNSSVVTYPMGGESELSQRVAQSLNLSPWFSSGPRVEHIIRSFQVQKKFIAARAFRHGRGHAMREAIFSPEIFPRKSQPIRSRIFCAIFRRFGLSSFGQVRWRVNWSRGYWSVVKEENRTGR